MCTAIGCRWKEYYFGRTLDYEVSYGETVTVVPRNFNFGFKGEGKQHYAMIGMTAGAHLSGEYPLFYDGANEKGLCMAGLNFVGNAVYEKGGEGKRKVAVYELIPWILGGCASVKEAVEALGTASLTDTPFRTPSGELLPSAELHWLIGDREGAVTVESTAEGLRIYDNPVCVLTNNPPFPVQLFSLNNYGNLSPKEREAEFSGSFTPKRYSRGMGAVGLPGDWSSGSRFVRAAFVKLNSLEGESEEANVGQFFHILDAVNVPRGSCILDNGGEEITVYTSCINGDKGIYYYTAYGNRQITAVDMREVDLDGFVPLRFPLITGQSIFRQN